MLIAFYWVQVNLKNSSLFAAEQIITACILKDWKLCSNAKEKIPYLLDNCGQEDYTQKEDIENEANNKVRKNIFSLFLKLENSKVTSIIKLEPWRARNSMSKLLKLKIVTLENSQFNALLKLD